MEKKFAAFEEDFRKKMETLRAALDGARSNWKINTKNVTGLVCGDAL